LTVRLLPQTHRFFDYSDWLYSPVVRGELFPGTLVCLWDVLFVAALGGVGGGVGCWGVWGGVVGGDGALGGEWVSVFLSPSISSFFPILAPRDASSTLNDGPWEADRSLYFSSSVVVCLLYLNSPPSSTSSRSRFLLLDSYHPIGAHASPPPLRPLLRKLRLSSHIF